jgi:ppGpp synthetase/RelA/SpoT-type nucleotidyltranferase
MNKFIKEYNDKLKLNSLFTKKIESLLIEILTENNIKFSSITSRLKSLDSFSKKVTDHLDKYQNYEEITDIVGERIILYFDDDVDKVATLIKNEFIIDNENSIDKRIRDQPDQFGYQSLHLIIQLNENRTSLLEYSKYAGIKAEIQIRSMLQHTWAEIEHDLGYKNKVGVPKEIRTRFARLAGLFDLADDEFVAIRDYLQQYQELINATTNYDEIEVDKISMQKLVAHDNLVIELDTRIASSCEATLAEKEHYIDSLLEKCNYFGITKMKDLYSKIEDRKDFIIKFSIKWISGKKYESLSKGISIFYFFYILSCETKDSDRILDFLNVNKIGISDNRQETTQRLLTLYNEINKAQ